MKNFSRFAKIFGLVLASLVVGAIGSAYAVDTPSPYRPLPPRVMCSDEHCHAFMGVTGVVCSAEGCKITLNTMRPDRRYASMFCDARGCLVDESALKAVGGGTCTDGRCLMEFDRP